jgi:hypothetical protein
MTFRITIDLEDDTIYAEDDEQVEEKKDTEKND